MANTLVRGTNCGNCRFFGGHRPGKKPSLDPQGGIRIEGAALKRAETADLITLPGRAAPGEDHICAHPKVDQPVNNRMCCAFWDNPGARREWEE